MILFTIFFIFSSKLGYLTLKFEECIKTSTHWPFDFILGTIARAVHPHLSLSSIPLFQKYMLRKVYEKIILRYFPEKIVFFICQNF